MLAPLDVHISFCQDNLKKFDTLFGTTCFDYLDEAFSDRRLVDEVMAAVRDVPQFKRKVWDHPRLFGLYRLTMYCLVRHVRPIRIIETGVLHGFSSLLILDALVRNGSGRLISIDDPSYFETGPANKDGFMDVLPKEMSPGWVVPERHRNFWDLRLGKSSALLGPTFKECQADIFLHDSEHTYETMMRELELAWIGVVEGGFIIADNIDTNTAFFDFANQNGRKMLVCSSDPSDEKYHQPIRFGVLRK